MAVEQPYPRLLSVPFYLVGQDFPDFISSGSLIDGRRRNEFDAAESGLFLFV